MADEEVQEAQAPEDIQIDDKRTDEGSAKETAPLGYVISSYGADYTVDGLIKRMREGSVYVPDILEIPLKFACQSTADAMQTTW